MGTLASGTGADRTTLLVVSDDTRLTRVVTELASGLGVETRVATSPSELAGALAHDSFALTLIDVDAGDLAALTASLEQAGPGSGAIVVLRDGSGKDWPAGAGLLPAAYLHKPPREADLAEVVRTALGIERLEDRGRLDEAARVLQDTGLWRSPRMREVWRLAQEAARVDVTVLVSGETGAGKDLVARAIHHLSSRQARPFVKVNCAAVPHDLLESEVFGHERGAFTGATQRRLGRFEAADQGTLFLDEIGDLALPLQAKLLQVLQDGTFSRLGGRHPVQVNARVVAATNKNLEDACAAGLFRPDLFYRLNVFPIRVPPLRERPEEIPLLAAYFADIYARQFGRPGFVIGSGALGRLCRYPFPGNVRELENVVRRMVVLGDPDLARSALEPQPIGSPGPERAEPSAPTPAWPRISLREIGRAASREAERVAIRQALEHTRWNRMRAARLLRVSYRALLYKIKEAGLDQGQPEASLNAANVRGEQA